MSAFLKIIVSVIIIALMLVSFWVFNYQPKQNQIADLDGKIAEQKQQYEELKVEAQNLERWEQARKEYQQILEKLHQTTALKDFIPSFLKDIEKLVTEERTAAGDPSFQVTSINPGSVQESASTPATGGGDRKNEAAKAQMQAVGGGKTVIQLTFTGRFNTLVDFLQQLGNFKLNKLVTIQRITLAPQGVAAPGMSPILTITMPFEVYMLGGG